MFTEYQEADNDLESLQWTQIPLQPIGDGAVVTLMKFDSCWGYTIYYILYEK